MSKSGGAAGAAPGKGNQWAVFDYSGLNISEAPMIKSGVFLGFIYFH
jgi:hypothetical protein